MTLIKKILAGAGVLLLAFSAGYFTRSCTARGDGPTIQPQGPIKEKVIYKPANCDEAWKCYYSSLFIRAAFGKRDVLTISAGNMCKEATQDFRVVCPDLSVPNHWQISPLILGGYDPSSRRADVLAGGCLGYIRGMGRVGLGLSGVYLKGLISGGHYGGASIIFQY